ncbi:MAG: TIGR04283 family arsenosugar biosynthesis glycosyltransferase [Planctomycetes bacterium]|nr:TIGR04283 family arsenosugar biosynthesis glycosyltransferase [Planctomycetota bacterium]
MVQVKALIVEYCRHPDSQGVKTRLAKTIGDQLARSVYKRMLQLVHHQLKASTNDNIKLCAYYDGSDLVKEFLEGSDFYLKQPSGDLEGRLIASSQFAFSNGYDIVMHCSSDCLFITTALIRKIIDLHNKYDVCIVPSNDGGYNIISFKNISGLAERIFSGVEFSTSRVLLQTVNKIQGLKITVLDPLPDIDNEDDLRVVRHSSPIPLSIIIPVYNDAVNLKSCLQNFLRVLKVVDIKYEVIVVDGGSSDDPGRVCSEFQEVNYLQSGKGRAVQMNMGARAALGRWLWFVHADTEIPEMSVIALVNKIRTLNSGWGFFDHSIVDASCGLRAIKFLNYLRGRLWYRPFGDQAIVIHSRLFDMAGGYPDEGFLEDLLISKKLRKCSAPFCIKDQVLITARHWGKLGTFKTTYRNWTMLYEHYFLKKRPGKLIASFLKGESRCY